MGGLLVKYTAFSDKWRDEQAIASKRAEFAAEMKRILDALSARIHLENENLYALIDREEIAVS